MINFQEHNGRKKANKFAEFITGETLRRYVADKVKQYAGSNVSVFDGAAGSGQLEQFISPREFVAVEIQPESCEALQKNYPEAQIHNTSFFLHQGDAECDCVIMNPPFSIKFKDLSEAEKKITQVEFPWKKSGVVDDIFVLKGLSQSSRWGFFILPLGVSYRGTEKMFRDLIGNQIAEMNVIINAFEDTSIDVLFLVLDKQKTQPQAKRERYDCKTKTVIAADEWEINPEHWEMVQPPVKEKEQVDFAGLEELCRGQIKESVISGVRVSKNFVTLGEFSVSGFNAFCDDLCTAIAAEKIPCEDAIHEGSHI